MQTSIAIVSGDFVATGGMDAANLRLASFLARSGHGVEIVAHRVSPALRAMPGVAFHRVPRPLRSHLLGAPLLDLAGRRIGAKVRAQGGRVIVNGGNCQVADVSWVHYVHAAFAGGRGFGRALKHYLALAQERRVLTGASLLIANSERTRRDLVDLVGAPPERIRVVYLGIDAEEFQPLADAERARRRADLGLSERPALAFVGAPADPRKGFDTLLQAWARLQKRGFDAELLVIGAGRSERAPSVRFLGFREDVGKILPALDGIVAPARYEAFGQAVHEGLCCGLPAIVSASAGVAEKIPEALQPLLLGDPKS